MVPYSMGYIYISAVYNELTRKLTTTETSSEHEVLMSGASVDGDHMTHSVNQYTDNVMISSGATGINTNRTINGTVASMSPIVLPNIFSALGYGVPTSLCLCLFLALLIVYKCNKRARIFFSEICGK